MFHLSENQVKFNCKIKHYKNGTWKKIICDSAIFKNRSDIDVQKEKEEIIQYSIDFINSQEFRDYLKENKIELKSLSCTDYNDLKKDWHYKKYGDIDTTISLVDKKSNRVRDDSLKRAKDKIFDIVNQNDWDYFLTLTFADKLCLTDSDFDKKVKSINDWFRNMTKRYGMKYLCIPEFHKSGAIHIHGLLSGDIEKFMVDSGTKSYKEIKKPIMDSTAIKKGLDISQGKIVYNFTSWTRGFSTAIRTYGDSENLAYYMTKYCTKDLKKIFGKYYWSSRNIDRFVPLTYENIDFDSVSAREFRGGNSLSFKYITNFSEVSQNEK